VWGSSLLFAAALLATGGLVLSDPPPAKPDCTVSDVDANAKPAGATLAPDVRRAIFIELQQVVSRAQREAAVAYPTAEGAALLSPTNVLKSGRLSDKRAGMAVSLEQSYLADVLKRRAVTCGTARDIMREGRAAPWPTKKLEEKR